MKLRLVLWVIKKLIRNNRWTLRYGDTANWQTKIHFELPEIIFLLFEQKKVNLIKEKINTSVLKVLSDIAYIRSYTYIHIGDKSIVKI